MQRFLFVSAALALVLGGERARADLLYANGSLSGVLGGYGITSPYQTSNSFTLTQTSTLTGAEVGLWVDSGATPTRLDWTISTQPTATPNISDDVPTASILFSGTASGSSLTNTLQFTGIVAFDIYDSDFPLSATLGPGTYYLSLGPNATASDSGSIYWDMNNGPSVAFQSGIGNLNGNLGPGSNSEYFEIFGSPAAAVPEPASLSLFAIGSLVAGGYCGWRRRRQMRAM